MIDTWFLAPSRFDSQKSVVPAFCQQYHMQGYFKGSWVFPLCGAVSINPPNRRSLLRCSTKCYLHLASTKRYVRGFMMCIACSICFEGLVFVGGNFGSKTCKSSMSRILRQRVCCNQLLGCPYWATYLTIFRSCKVLLLLKSS